jgi:1-acyl-sn-glycerol-3-phosphate acyltransferase
VSIFGFLPYLLCKLWTKVVESPPARAVAWAAAAKCALSKLVLVLLGVHLEIEGLEEDDGNNNKNKDEEGNNSSCGGNPFGKECVLACFSHSSNLDAVIIYSAIPTFHYTIGKADLFAIPFLSCIMAAFGVVPVDRSNREQALRAFGDTLEGADRRSGECLAISPEGTRVRVCVCGCVCFFCVFGFVVVCLCLV